MMEISINFHHVPMLMTVRSKTFWILKLFLVTKESSYCHAHSNQDDEFFVKNLKPDSQPMSRNKPTLPCFRIKQESVGDASDSKLIELSAFKRQRQSTSLCFVIHCQAILLLKCLSPPIKVNEHRCSTSLLRSNKNATFQHLHNPQPLKVQESFRSCQLTRHIFPSSLKDQ